MPHEIVRAAREWIGTPYRHQASLRGAGCDCLGLVRGVWREVVGREPAPVPPYGRDWSEPEGEERLWRAARLWLQERGPNEPTQSGDLLLFRMRDRAVAKHVGIVGNVGDRPTFIHAYSGHAVLESPLTQPWARRIAARFVFPVAKV